MGMSAHCSMKASRMNPWARSWNVSSNSTSSSSRTAVSGKAGRAWSTYVRGRRGSATAISIKLRPRLLNSASMKSRALAKQRLMLTGGHGFPGFNVLAGGEASEVLVVVLAPVTQMGRRHDRRAPTVTRTHILVLSVATASLGSVPLFRGDPKKFRQLYLRPDDIPRSRPRFLGSQCDDKPPKEHSSPQSYDGDRNRLPHQYSDAERGDGATGNDQQKCGGLGSALRPILQFFPIHWRAGRWSGISRHGLIPHFLRTISKPIPDSRTAHPPNRELDAISRNCSLE